MASVGDVLKEFIIGISYSFNEESEKKVLTGLDRIEAETKRLSAVEQRAAQQTTATAERERKKQTAVQEKEHQKQAESAVRTARQIHAAMEQYAVAGLRKVAAAAATVVTAFAGFSAIQQTFQNLQALDNFSRQLGVAAKDVQVLTTAIEDMGGTKNDALSMIQSVSSAILQNRGTFALMRSIGVTETKTNVEQMRQLSGALTRIAKQYGQDVGYLYAQQFGLSESLYRTMLRHEEFVLSLEKSQQLTTQWKVNSEKQTEVTRAFGDQLAYLTSQAEILSNKILTAFLPAITPFLAKINTALFNNAGAISTAIDNLGKSLEAWSAEKGKQFTDWLEKISQPGTKERDDLVRWLENTQRAALGLASSIGSVASALHTLLTPLVAIGNFIEKHPGLISVLTWSPHRKLLMKGLEALEDGAGEAGGAPAAPTSPAAPAPPPRAAAPPTPAPTPPAPEALNWWDRLHRRLGTGKPEVPAPASPAPTPLYEPYAPTPAPAPTPTPAPRALSAPAPEPYVPTPDLPGPLGRILSLFKETLKDHDFTGEGQDKQTKAADTQTEAADTFKKAVEEDKRNREEQQGVWGGLKNFLGGLTSRLGLGGMMGLGGEGGGAEGAGAGGAAGGGGGPATHGTGRVPGGGGSGRGDKPFAGTLAAPGGEGVQRSLGVSAKQWDTFRRTMAGIESQGQYGIKGGSSNRFSGAYQFGAQEIRDTAQRLGETPPTREQFLADPAMQERYLGAYTQGHHETLMNTSPEYRALTAEQKLAALGYAHNQGAGGAAQWLRSGQAGSDAFGTAGTRYSQAISRNLGEAGASLTGGGARPSGFDQPVTEGSLGGGPRLSWQGVNQQGFSNPVMGGKVISEHGASREGGIRSHKGIDINAPTGTPIRATTDQTITHVGKIGGKYGFGIKAVDAQGREHVYAHMVGDPKELGFRVGSEIKSGQTIGGVGQTGNARTTPPHLHYEVRPRVGAYNESYNPRQFLGASREQPAAVDPDRTRRDQPAAPAPAPAPAPAALKPPSGDMTGLEFGKSVRGSKPELIVRPGERGHRDPAAADRVRANAERLSSNGNAPGQPAPALTSGPVENDNSRSVNMTNHFKTNITAADASTIGRDVRRNQELQTGMALGHLRTAMRA